jgi:hypothetical protein
MNRHLALYPLLDDATITTVCLRYSSDGYCLRTGSSGVDHHWGVFLAE